MPTFCCMRPGTSCDGMDRPFGALPADVWTGRRSVPVVRLTVSARATPPFTDRADGGATFEGPLRSIKGIDTELASHTRRTADLCTQAPNRPGSTTPGDRGTLCHQRRCPTCTPICPLT